MAVLTTTLIHIWTAVFTLALFVGSADAQSLDAAATATTIHNTAAETPTVWRITFHGQAELAQLAALTDPWEVNFSQQYLLTPLLPEQVEFLEQHYKMEPDPNASARLASLRKLRTAETTSNVAGIPGYACYRTVEETYDDLTRLAQQYPHLASWIDVGDSWSKTIANGGYDINVLVITNRNLAGPKFRFFLLGAVHARELVTAETATRFAERLVTAYGSDPDITWLLDYGEVHILPMANPDGRKMAEGLSSWRKNTNSSNSTCPGGFAPFSYGIDLNRNSSYRWNECESGGCSSADPCAAVYRGPTPASEPETQALQNYLASIFPSRTSLPTLPSDPDLSGLFISLHSYGEWILFPWGYTGAAAPDHDALSTLGRKFGFLTDYKVCQSGAAGCLYPTDGTTDDWVYGELGIPAYTFELGTWFFQACTDFEEAIVEPTLDALLLAFKASLRPLKMPAGPEIVTITPVSDRIRSGQPFTLSIAADDTRFASGGYGEEPSQPIRALRVSVGQPIWSTPDPVTITLPVSQTQPQTTTEVPFPAAPYLLGRHLLFVQAMDGDGNWGLPSAQYIMVEHPSLHTSLSSSLGNFGAARPGDQVTFTIQVTLTTPTTSSRLIQEVQLSPNWVLLTDTGPIQPPNSGSCRVLNDDAAGPTLRWQVEMSGALSTCHFAFSAEIVEQPALPMATVTVTTTDVDFPAVPIVDTFSTLVAPTALHFTSVKVEQTGPQDTTITWQIADSLYPWGFHVWRASEANRMAAIRLTANPILATTGKLVYQLRDQRASPDPDTESTYWIEVMGISGQSLYYGPYTPVEQKSRRRYLPDIRR